MWPKVGIIVKLEDLRNCKKYGYHKPLKKKPNLNLSL